MVEETIQKMLFEGLENVLDTEQFQKKTELVIKNAFDKIILDTMGQKIIWIRDLNHSDYKSEVYTAETIVENVSNKSVVIPVLFYSDYFPKTENKIARLQLGKNGPYLNTAMDERIKKLAIEHFKIKGLTDYPDI